MNKRHLHHYWRIFRQVKPRYFLLLAAICSVVCLFALRANNEQMAELRSTLYTVDEQGGDVQAALNNLQAHVTAHMNTSLSTGNTAVYPPVQLQHTYQRLVQEKAASQQGANGDLYTRAQEYCQSQNASDFSGRNRVPCIEQYVQQNGSAQTPQVDVPASLYQFDFVAPKWSPDLAGWTLFGTIFFTFIAIIKLIADLYLKRKLR